MKKKDKFISQYGSVHMCHEWLVMNTLLSAQGSCWDDMIDLKKSGAKFYCMGGPDR